MGWSIGAGPARIGGNGRFAGELFGMLMLIAIIAAPFVLAVHFWRVSLALLAVAALLWKPLRKRYLAHKERQRIDEVERLRAWLAAPPPTLEVPLRFSEPWFAAAVPALHPGQLAPLVAALRARGWDTKTIHIRLTPYISNNPYIDATQFQQAVNPPVSDASSLELISGRVLADAREKLTDVKSRIRTDSPTR